MKIFSIVGARPQFIKAAMLCREFLLYNDIEHHLLHTGQHHDTNMSQVFFEEMGIPEPLVNFDINGGTHGYLTGSMLIEIEKFILSEKPDHVVVFGDTDTTLAGALAAAKLNIQTSHVEAGLRSFNRNMPEEINRILADEVSDYLFAPTKTAVKNLLNENKPSASIFLSGDIMFDAALHAAGDLNNEIILKKYNLTSENYILVTIHRASNTDDSKRLATWLAGLNEVGRKTKVLFPIHPRTLRAMHILDRTVSDYSNIEFVNPVSYKEIAVLVKHAKLVATDSGGLQKEAYFHKVPGIILRDETEWVELVESGWSKLVSCSVEELTATCECFEPQSPWTSDLYGEGTTSKFIAEVIRNSGQ